MLLLHVITCKILELHVKCSKESIKTIYLLKNGNKEVGVGSTK
jgi:hypothetical protein